MTIGISQGGNEMQVLTFGLHGEIFALDAHMVREILDVLPVTEVPGANPFVGGLINVRGRVVPLADLKVRLGLPPGERTSDSRIIVVEMTLKGEPAIVGLAADKVHEVTGLSTAAIEDAPDIGMKWPVEYIRGIGKRGGAIVFIPDMNRIFAD